ncbi:MAG: Ig-like domain-containing protein [Candidatus Sericytochromatia bacterium]|nr:Ig-like domain-containing protein [Candidatus Tanganyikabacteria bacterium]
MRRILPCACALVLATSCALLPFNQAAPPAPPATTNTSVTPEGNAPAPVVFEGSLQAPAALATAAGYRTANVWMVPVNDAKVIPVPTSLMDGVTNLDQIASRAEAQAERRRRAHLKFSEVRSVLLEGLEPIVNFNSTTRVEGKPDPVYDLPVADLATYSAPLQGLLERLAASASADLSSEAAAQVNDARIGRQVDAGTLGEKVSLVRGRARSTLQLLERLKGPAGSKWEINSRRSGLSTSLNAFARHHASLKSETISKLLSDLKEDWQAGTKAAEEVRTRYLALRGLTLAGCALVASATTDSQGKFKVSFTAPAGKATSTNVIYTSFISAEAIKALKEGRDVATLEGATAYWGTVLSSIPIKDRFAYTLKTNIAVINGLWQPKGAAGYRAAGLPGMAMQMTLADGSRAADITPGTTFAVSSVSDFNVTDLGAFEEIAKKAAAVMSEEDARLAATGKLAAVAESLLSKDSDLRGLVANVISKAQPNPPDPEATPTPAPGPTPQPQAAFVMVVASDTRLHLAGTGEGTDLLPSETPLSAEVRMTDGATHSAVTWQTSDAAVAAVDGSGRVTAGSKAGTAVITAVSSDGKASGSIEIAVQSGGLVEVEVR